MNYHSDEWIMAGIQKHYNEVLCHYRPEQIVGLFYIGAANYNVDHEDSDVDTWALVFEDDYNDKVYQIDMVHFKDEVIFYCDIRAYINGIYHSDRTYLPGLYTKYRIINPLYSDLFNELIVHKEQFAYNDVANAVKEAKIEITQKHILNFYNKTTKNSYGKILYYCFLNFICINIYRYRENYSSCFYNEFYVKELLKIKQCKYSFKQSENMLKYLLQKIKFFNPTNISYPPVKGLDTFIEHIKEEFIKRYNNECSN